MFPGEERELVGAMRSTAVKISLQREMLCVESVRARSPALLNPFLLGREASLHFPVNHIH